MSRSNLGRANLSTGALLSRIPKSVSPKHFARRLLSAAVISCLASTALADNHSVVLEKSLNLNLPQQSLARSVTDLAEEAGVVVLLKPGQFQQLPARALSGEMSLEQALELLLDGSGYGFSVEQGNRLVLKPLVEAAVNEPSMVVYGTKMSRYEFDEAESATGFIADVDELPRSVQVLPEQLALDQNASNLTDVLINAAGVTRAHGFGGAETQVNIRGFTNNHIFVDGNPVSSRYNIDIANVESAEVILGPASVLHGQVSPGGLVNIVTKQPQEESAHSIQLELDENGKQKMVLDSTGSLNDELQYRIVVSGEDSESFREVVTTDGTFATESQSFMIAPSLRYTPDEQNTYTLRFSHSSQNLPIDRGAVAVEDADGNITPASLPTSRRLGSEFDERDAEDTMLQFDWDHEFANGWINRLKVGHYEKQYDDYQARPLFGLNGNPANILQFIGFRNGTAVQANGLLARTADSNMDVKETDTFISDSLTGNYRLGEIDNTLYLGANYYQRGDDHTDGFALQDASAFLGVPNLYVPYLDAVNIYDDLQPAYARQAQTRVSHSDATFKELGFSVQNLSYLTESVNLLAGLRYDRFEMKSDETIYYQAQANGTYLKLDTPSEFTVESQNDNVSGQLGVIWDLNPQLSLYGSYSESFLPNYPDVTAGAVSTAEDFEPEESSQFEVGAKSSLMDDKLRLSMSIYKLTRENVMTFENLQARLNGEEQTRGVDLSATMQFIPGLNVLASYSYMDSEIIDDNSDGLNHEGNRPFSVPQNKARIWGSYEFQGGDYAGLGFGLGAEYVDERFGNDANTFTLPGYTVFDAAAWYYLPVGNESQLRLQAGVRNLTDKEYFSANGSGNAYRLNVGEPRTVYMTLRYEF